MRGRATVSIYHQEAARVRAGQPEKNRWLESRQEVEYDSLDHLCGIVREWAQTRRGALVQCFIWLDEQKGSIHFSYEVT